MLSSYCSSCSCTSDLKFRRKELAEFDIEVLCKGELTGNAGSYVDVIKENLFG